MQRFSDNGPDGPTFDNTTALRLALVRVALLSVCIALLLTLRDAVPAWETLYWTTLAVGVTSIVLFVWAKTKDDYTPLSASAGFDLLLLLIAIYTMAQGTTNDKLPPGFIELGLVLAIPVGMFHFGRLAGTVSALAVTAWYLLMFSVIMNAPGGMMLAFVQGTSALVIGGLIAVLFDAMRQQELLRLNTEVAAAALAPRAFETFDPAPDNVTPLDRSAA